MMYTEDDFLPLSGLQHILFCERQCALIYVEQAWAENRLTAEGRIMHERVHQEGMESRRDTRIEFGMPLHSFRLGIIGKADAVEFHRNTGKNGKKVWIPFPVEYKRGKPKKDNSDKVQLCAQAICLEEMMGIAVPAGALFYGKTRRRLDVVFDNALRLKTEDAAMRFHELMNAGRTPKPVYSKKCDNCSMYDLCLPKTLKNGRSVSSYLMKAVLE